MSLRVFRAGDAKRDRDVPDRGPRRAAAGPSIDDVFAMSRGRLRRNRTICSQIRHALTVL
jgi:hypothetical protein